MSTSNKLIYVIALVVLFAAGLLADKYAPWKGQPKADPGYANLGGDFTLDSAAGKVQLQDFRGQLVLMYFGFTSCPEICPTALSGMASISSSSACIYTTHAQRALLKREAREQNQ